MSAIKAAVFCAILLCLGVPPAHAGGSVEVTPITIDPAREHQSIICFGASGAWSIDHVGAEWTEENRSRVADLLFSTDRGIGLSGWKFLIGAGSEATDTNIITAPNEWRRSQTFRPDPGAGYDWTRQAGQRWFLDAARSRGVASLQGIAYSPPSWMTKNGHAEPDPGSGPSNITDERMPDFADYLADITAHFGFTDLFPVNEPNWDWNGATQEGNRYTVDQIVRLVRLLHAALVKRGVTAGIVVPEAGELKALAEKDYARELLGRADLRAMLASTISAHSYWSGDDGFGDSIVTIRQQARDAMRAFAAQAVFRQTEYCILGPDGPGRDLGMDPALRMARLMQLDLTILDASEWSWWLALSPYDYKDGLLYTDYRVPGDPETIHTSRLFWAFGNFSRYIRPGYTRIEVDGPLEPHGLLVSAFRDPRDAHLVVVLVNVGSQPRPLEIWIAGAAGAAPFLPVITSGEPGDELRRLPPVHLPGPFTVPARSVVTLVSGG